MSGRDDSEQANQPKGLGVFYGACWALGLVAFVEVAAIGVALAVRSNPGAQVIEVPRYVAMGDGSGQAIKEGALAGEKAGLSGVEAVREFEKFAGEGKSLPERARGGSVFDEGFMHGPPPAVENPVVERLLNEARGARVKGDMRLAMVKLEEAQVMAEADEGGEPNVFYELALVYEGMGIYDKALDYYHEVYEMGSPRARGLYSLAARKLTEGFEERNDLLVLGRVREFRDKRVTRGQRIVLTVPVIAGPGERIDPNEVQVEVSLYDKEDGKVVLPDPSSKPTFRWVSEPVDWKGVKEELLQVVYEIKPKENSEGHLFGEREYYGHVAELYYRGEVIDQQAWPRLLAREKNVPERDPLFMPEGYLPEDYNPQNPLLPVLED